MQYGIVYLLTNPVMDLHANTGKYRKENVGTLYNGI